MNTKARKTETREVTYLGRRARVTTEHHDSNPIGDRTITTEWLDDADEANGGYPAGTVTRKRMRGDGRYIEGHPKAAVVIEAEAVIQ